MSIRISVQDIAEDGLSSKEWIFMFFESQCELILDGYREEERPTKRHGWKSVRFYDRIGSRGTYTPHGTCMQENEVPFTEGIKGRALAQFENMIKVRLWSERKS